MFGHKREMGDFEAAAMPHLNDLFRTATRVVGDRSEAEDLVQEAYLQAWRSFHRFEPGTNCRAWLYKILFTCLSRDRRARARQPVVVDLEAATEKALRFDPATPDTLTVDSVNAAFERIPDPFR